VLSGRWTAGDELRTGARLARTLRIAGAAGLCAVLQGVYPDPERAMTRRKRKSELRKRGGGAARNPNSLANLRQPPPAPTGNQLARTHGYRSEVLVRDVEAEVRELMDALAESAPVREADGSLPGADTVAVEAAARALKRYRAVTAWCDLHGRLDEKTGDVKQVARYEMEGERALQRCLDALGMSPMARSKLGLNVARMAAQRFDLAARWAAEGEASDGA
jgi:hypothetical protein